MVKLEDTLKICDILENKILFLPGIRKTVQFAKATEKMCAATFNYQISASGKKGN